MNPLTTKLKLDSREYDFGDSSSTIRTTPRRWRWITEGTGSVPPAALVAMEAIADVLEAAGGSGTSLDELSEPVWRHLEELAVAHGPRTKIVDVLGPHDPLVIATEECDLMLSAAARVVAGGFGSRGEGSVAAVHVSDGGAPKAPVDSVEVGPRGPVGDRQAERAHHGRPYQAVSLYSLELVEALAGEGHPITPGAVGENILLTGIDWQAVRPGQRVVIGQPDDQSAGGVVLELNAWAPPCRTIADAFIDRRFERIDPDRYPGWARAYAWVISGGTVTRGDEVELLS